MLYLLSFTLLTAPTRHATLPPCVHEESLHSLIVVSAKVDYLWGEIIFTSPPMSYKGHVQTLYFFSSRTNATVPKAQTFNLNASLLFLIQLQMKADMYHTLLTIEVLNWITSCRRANDGFMFELWFIITLWRVCHILFTKPGLLIHAVCM